MKFQSILTKSLAAAALTATGLVALNSQNTNDAQAATIVQNDTNVVTINNANSTVASKKPNLSPTSYLLPSKL